MERSQHYKNMNIFFKKINYTKNRNKKLGFALLFSVITASILLSIGLSVFNISLKELLLSTASRDSQIAFYSADSARECAIYWDLKHAAFRTCLTNSCTGEEISNGLGEIYCASQGIALFPKKTGLVHETLGKLVYSEEQQNLGTTPESDFSVIKGFSGSDIETTINAYGHNAEIGERRLERGILQTY